MKHLLTIIYFCCLYGCLSKHNRNNLSGKNIHLEDTLSLTRIAYEEIRRSYNDDTAFISFLSSRIASEDAEAIKIKRLLHTSYENRIDSTGFTSGKIDSIFYALRISKEVFNRIDSLDKYMKKVNPDSIKESADKWTKEMEDLLIEMKKNDNK